MRPRFCRCLSFSPLLAVCIGLAPPWLSAQNRTIRVGDRVIPPDMPVLLTMGLVDLYSPNPQVRGRGAQALAAQGPDAAPTLVFLTDWLSDTTRISLESKVGSTAGQTIETSPGSEAMGALVAIGRAAVEILLESLANESPFIRQNAYESLSEAAAGAVNLDPRFADAILVGLADEDARISANSVRWAERYVEEAEGPALSRDQRSALLEALGRIQADLVGDLSLEAVKRSSREIPTDLDPELRSLIERLRHADGLERGRAALALQEVGPEAGPAVPWLVDLLTDESPLLMTRTGGMFGDQEWETSPSELSVEALIAIGEDAIPALQDAIRHPDAAFRNRVVREFSIACDGPICYDDRFVEIMVELLDADLPRAPRYGLFVWISRYVVGNPPAIPPGSRRAELLEPVMHFLEARLEDGSEVHALGDVAEALGGYGPEAAAALPLLREAATRVNEEDRAQIQEAIQKIEGD